MLQKASLFHILLQQFSCVLLTCKRKLQGYSNGPFFVALAGGNTELTIQIKLKDDEYNAPIDSGASLSFIKAANVPKDCETFEYVENKIFALSGNIKVLGFIRPFVRLTKHVSFIHELIILDDNHKMPQKIF